MKNIPIISDLGNGRSFLMPWESRVAEDEGVVGARGWSEMEDFYPAIGTQPLLLRTRSGISNRSDHGKFRYDQLSYSLNFDDGKQTGHFDDEFPYRDYSMRFAAPSLPVDFDN